MSDTTRVPLSAATVTALYRDPSTWFTPAELALAVAPAYAQPPLPATVGCVLEVFTATNRVMKFQLYPTDTPLYKLNTEGYVNG